MTYLTVLFVQSHVVFKLPRALAALDGVAAPDDTPQFFTRSSVSFRHHWLVFHQSLTLFFLRRVFTFRPSVRGAQVSRCPRQTMVPLQREKTRLWGTRETEL